MTAATTNGTSAITMKNRFADLILNDIRNENTNPATIAAAAIEKNWVTVTAPAE